MKNNKNNALNNDEKNNEKLTEQKNSLMIKLDEMKKKTDAKEQKMKRLSEKKDNLEKENEEIKRFYNRLIERRDKLLFDQPISNNQQKKQEKGEDEDEKEFELKLEDKIEFNLEQYLTELENSIKKDMKEQNKILSGDTANSSDMVEYQKSQVNAVCIKFNNSERSKSFSTEEKAGNTFKISKKTKISELKYCALKFWQKEEKYDQYEFVDLELNQLPITTEETEVDTVFQKLTEQKLTTLILRHRKPQDDRKAIEYDTKNESGKKDDKEGEAGDSNKKKQSNKDKDQLDQIKNKKNDIMRAFDKFFQNLPLLRPYFAFKDQDIVQKTDKDSVKIGLIVDDYSCIAALLLLVLYILTLLSMQSNENLEVSYTHSTKLVYYTDIDNNSAISFAKIKSFEDLQVFLVESNFSKQLFDVESQIRQNYQVLGAVRIRQVRTREQPCPVQPSSVKCYYTSYNEVTKQKNPINYGKFVYEIYQNIHQSGTLRSIGGKFDTYDSSGYIYDISQDFEFNDYVVRMKELFNNNVLNDASIRAIFIQFTLLNNEDGTTIFFELILENTAFGIFTKYNTSIYKSINDQNTCTLDPKLFITIFFTLFYLYQFIQQGFTYIFSLIGLLNLILQVFIYLSINQECSIVNYDLGFKPTVNQFIDIGLKTDSYQMMVMFQSISCGSCLLRLVFFMEFFNSFRKIMQAINHGLLSLYISIVFILLLISSFALVFMNEWGQWIPQANTFIKSFFSLLLMIIGCFDFSQIEYDVTALIFFIFVFFVFAFFLMNIITITHIDEYRQIVLLYGDESQAKYKLKDNLRWLMIFLPDKLQKYILKIS